MWKTLIPWKVFSLFYFCNYVEPFIDALNLSVWNPYSRASRETTNLYIYGPSGKSPVKRPVNDDLLNLPIDDSYGIRIIIHDWQESHDTEWIEQMIAEFEKNRLGNNYIIVDWEEAELKYDEAAAAVGNVGKKLSGAIAKITKNYDIPDYFLHFIGFGLGAHIAGSASRSLKRDGIKADRISGLDPSRSQFESPETYPALKSSDAVFVDVIHTSGDGVYYSIGHVDFFPNGGSFQSGCPKLFRSSNLFGINDRAYSKRKSPGSIVISGCSHLRAPWYYVESINSNEFVALECGSQYKYSLGMCNSNTQNMMGAYADRKKKGEFYVSTHWGSPYAKS